MATSKTQRISIIIIAVVMVGGTLGFYFLTILTNNQQTDQVAQQQALQDQQNQVARDRQKTLRPLDGYSASTFDASKVTSLQTTDLVAGDGKEVTAGATIKANYFGWTPDGAIFDSTNASGTVTPAQFSLTGVIEGWQKGIPGMKVGGVRKLVIPADQAYGSTGSAPFINPNTPLTFIVQLTEVD